LRSHPPLEPGISFPVKVRSVDVATGGDVAGGGCVVAGDCWPACVEPPQPATRTANRADPISGATCLCTPALSRYDRGNAMVEDFPIPDLAISLGSATSLKRVD